MTERSSPVTSELLPCPFCGEKRVSLNEPSEYNRYGSINCPACLAVLPGAVKDKDQGELIASWNARAPLPSSAGTVDPLMTPKEFVNSILSACDASNWDADRNKGDYYRGLHDAYEAIQEIAIEYQTAMYKWTRPSDLAQGAPKSLYDYTNEEIMREYGRRVQQALGDQSICVGLPISSTERARGASSSGGFSHNPASIPSSDRGSQ